MFTKLLTNTQIIMSEGIIGWLVVVALVQLTTLIVFFVMAGNVAAIKRSVVKSWKTVVFDAEQAEFRGDKEMARMFYMNAKFMAKHRLGVTQTLDEAEIIKKVIERIDQALIQLDNTTAENQESE